jgi:hypothetical protein
MFLRNSSTRQKNLPSAMLFASSHNSIRRPFKYYLNALRSTFGCLGTAGHSSVDSNTTLDRLKLGAPKLDRRCISIYVRCFEEDDQASESLPSGSGPRSPNSLWPAANKLMPFLPFSRSLASKLSKLQFFGACIGHHELTRTPSASFTDNCEGVKDVLEEPVLLPAVQDKCDDKAMPDVQQLDSQVCSKYDDQYISSVAALHDRFWIPNSSMSCFLSCTPDALRPWLSTDVSCMLPSHHKQHGVHLIWQWCM